jgi:MOSC domain-containing protein YiiM
MNLRIRSVNIGRPRLIGTWNGEPVLSGIAKTPVSAESLFVGSTNIAGDGQADLTVHGGPDKAVYAYSSAHWPWWEGEKHLSCGPATFGENLTLDGADENDVRIGDRFRWGDAILEVSQPRAPCYKLAIHTAREDVPALMTVSARSGFYLRVISEGEAPIVGATMERIEQSGGPSVREAFVALFDPRISTEERVRVHDTVALAEAWRRGLAMKLAVSRRSMPSK